MTFWQRLKRALALNSLWVISVGVMLASSGIDGAYLARLMPAWLGYVLNTTTDIASEVLMYWFGRLRLEPKNSKKHKFALGILPGVAILAGYAWLFGWRQLLIVLAEFEGAAAPWLAFVAAGFTPLTLIALGFTQAIISGRFKDAADATTNATDAAQPQHSRSTAAAVTLTVANYRAHVAAKAQENGSDAAMTREAALGWAADAGMDVTGASGRSNRDKVLRWWRQTQEETQQ